VLWAFDAFSKNYVLKVSPAELIVKRGDTRSVTVTDGMSGVPIAGAVIDGVTTDAIGVATLTFPTKGGLVIRLRGMIRLGVMRFMWLLDRREWMFGRRANRRDKSITCND